MAKKNKKLKYSRGYRKKSKKVSGQSKAFPQESILQQALTLHQAGHLSQAEAIYGQILSAAPDHPEALHYLGMLAHQVGKNEVAVELISKALSSRPDYAEAYINLGGALNAQGKLDEAAASYRQALTLKPENADAHYNLGNVLRDQGKLHEAITSYRRALTLKPDDIDALINLGNALNEQGSLDEAVASYRRALNLKPDFAYTYINLGNVLKDQGRLDEAEASYRRALSLNPDSAMAHFTLGNVLNNQEKPHEAIASYRRALSLKPDYADGYNNLGNVLKDQGKLDEAAACFRQALSIKSDYVEAHYNLGNTLKDQGKLDEAMASFHQALKLKPEYAECHNCIGAILKELGQKDDAVASIRKALLYKPDYAAAYRSLSSIIKFTEVDDDVQAMEKLHKNEELPDEARVDLGFALGKVYEDLGDHDTAIDYILSANHLERKSYHYAVEDDQAFFDRIKMIFSPDFFISHHDCLNRDKTPIFILGMPRTGTSLVEQILASHPLVFGAGELVVLANVINIICTATTKLQFPECLKDLDKGELERMGAEYIIKIRGYSKDAVHITDKMPHNFLRVGLIKTILPNAKVIHCVRNPMDTCFSIFKKRFKGIHRYAYDLVELGQYYNLYQDLMAHWEKVLPGFMYTIKYEDVVSDQQKQTKNLLEFCGLPWDEACLAFHKTERRVQTASLAQVRQPIYKDSVELWKRYEKQLEPLRKAIYG